MTEAEAIGILKAYKAKGGNYVGFCGGEVTLKLPLLTACLSYCASNGIETNILSNGWWGRHDKASKYITALLDAGLSSLQISFDRFHARFNSWENVKRILEFAGERIKVGIFWVTHETDIVTETRELCGIDFDYVMRYPIINGRVQRIGRALNLDYTVRLPMTSCDLMIRDDPTIMMLPGGKFSFRCAVYAPHRSHDNGADWTRTVEKLESSKKTQYFKRYGFSEMISLYDGRYYTNCDFCKGELARYSD